ncbi:Hypothetical predicted protein [Paramuricea clavata]|uniref:Uncharacterized protein n=1 Tax=Paramuricea clavata TaxID=317549 RepID=A0A7D9E5H7_PARCT|nr:Hypothetical predicted protein [Paramuricea clavata]
MHNYTEYRVLRDGIKICNSTGNYVRNIWKERNKWVKAKIHQKSCNKPIRESWLYQKYYTVNKQFTVYLGRRGQYFTRNDYGVDDGKPFTCQEKFRPESSEYTLEDLLMCNNSIFNIKYDDEYKVLTDFSILYKNKVYDYTEYRVLNDSIKICNSTDNCVRNIWKVRNKWVKAKIHQKSCNKPIRELWLYRKYYTVNKQFTVYSAAEGQHFTRNEYGVKNSKPYTCDEKFKPDSTEYTQEDLLMCNDSIINIKYDDEYKVGLTFQYSTRTRNDYGVKDGKPFTCQEKFRSISTEYTQEDLLMCKDSIINIKYDDEFKVRSDFSILYKNKVYNYTEYRVLNDGIKICNSTDNNVNVRNIWKARNKWSSHFGSKAADTKYDYVLFEGKLMTCVTACANFTFTIKYEDEYRVWNNFSMMYQGRMYSYDEYRITYYGLQVCNSSDRLIKEKWGNFIVSEKITIAFQDCNVSVDGFYSENYTLHTNFTVLFKPTNQIFRRQNYGVIMGYFAICSSKLTLSCNDDLVKVKYGDQYNVFKNFFSLVYNNKIYDYREYRFSHNSLEKCASNDSRVQAIWRTQNSWQKSLSASCNGSYKLNARYYTVTKQFAVYSADNGQYFKRNDYAVLDGKLFEIPCARLFVANKFMAYSIIMNAAVNIHHLRKTFCGNTLVKSDELKEWNRFLKYSFFSWGVPIIITIVHIVLVKEDVLRFDQPIASAVKNDVQSSLRFYRRIANGNATANNIGIYHRVASLKDNVLQSKSRLNQSTDNVLEDAQSKLNQSIVLGKEDATEDDARIYQPIVSLKKDVQSSLKFYERIVFANGDGKEDDARIYQQISGDCINGRITPDWSAAVDVYGLQGCLLLYIIGMFIFTAYRIRQKLKASRNIAQKSNVVKRRKFVILLKLSTTTALSYWFPLFISRIVEFDFDIKIALYTVTLLTGAYIGIAFACLHTKKLSVAQEKIFPSKQ